MCRKCQTPSEDPGVFGGGASSALGVEGPSCLRAVAVVALLVREATKLTFSQDLIIKVHMKSTPSFEETPTSGYQIPRLFNTRDCYVKTPTSVLSLAGV